MEQKVGISLCISGLATKIAGSHLCNIERGIAMIISPALPTVEVERSDDFQECHCGGYVGHIGGDCTFPSQDDAGAWCLCADFEAE